MPRGSLPEEAFEHYVALGPGRNYQAVAEHFGTSKRSVARKAAEEDWQGRLTELEVKAREGADARAAHELAEQQGLQLAHLGKLQGAIREVLTPDRLKAVVVALVKAAVQKEDVAAARLLLERVLGRPRSEPLAPVSIDLPDGLQTAGDIRVAANAILQAVADGSLAPEDAQRASSVLEAARRSVEAEELEQRIAAIEERVAEERGAGRSR